MKPAPSSIAARAARRANRINAHQSRLQPDLRHIDPVASPPRDRTFRTKRAEFRLARRGPLRRALDLAQRCGAVPLAEAARRELLATGARPRRTALTGPGALTSTERQVAGLAAEGRSNRQIAQHLFLTLPTVETHLRHAFRKLGITSRGELAAQLRG
jgi:DNA-binding CsgD family transcriptional regulator